MALFDILSETAPNGHFIRDMIVFGGLRAGDSVAKGFIFEPPDLANAAISDLNTFQNQLTVLLASLGDHQRLQVQWFCDSDYRHELLAYHDETQKADNIWTRRVRNERFTRYWEAMANRKLRRQRLVLWISRRIDVSPPPASTSSSLARHYDHMLDQLEQEFVQVREMLGGIFAGQGARLLPMTDADHYRHYARFLNPSFADRFDYDPLETFDPQRSIQENCWHSEGNGLSDSGFWMDGHYHSILTISRWPRATFPGITHRLTHLRLLDYSITVNVAPLSVRNEITREEKAHDRIAGDYASEKKVSLLTALQKKERKIAALSEGHTLPFQALFVIRAWDKTQAGLSAKTTAIKNAINSMNGAQYVESSLPGTTRKLFFQTWPGWLWSRYECRNLYAEHAYLADMLPISATFTGHLNGAEALYDGGADNLVGLRTFIGGTPQHAVLLGMSGAGKSVTMCDLLSQTELYYDYTVLIEEGLSYGIYTRTVEPGAEPIILQPDGTHTLNYLDTTGLPLTPLHLSTATALVARMAGLPSDEDRQRLQQAQISRYLNQLYEDAFSDWMQRHPDKIVEVARHAFALADYRRNRMPPGASFLEGFADFRDWSKANPDESSDYISTMGEGDILRFLKDPKTSREVRNLAFSYFTPAEQPTHQMLQELMHLESHGPEKDSIRQIATLLLPWCRNGLYGPLFDGETNLSLTGRIAHFELGCIPESAPELKAAAGFLISHYTRQHLVTLPRSQRKRIVYEEVARFLDIPEGEKIVRETYAQMRKFNCWAVSIVQQYSRFKESRIRSTVFGNSRQFILMRQNDRADLEDISQDIELPDITRQRIMNYPLPDQQPGQKFSAFTYFHLDTPRPVCGTVHNIASPEMLYCSSSSGDHFERRAQELKGHGNIIEGIAFHAQSKPEPS
ncbi:MAG: TraC family protein [Akkermansiaceae bacterium]|nr:TraC family protein [Akkermansiaceae bacterium]